MALVRGPNIVTDGLVFTVDAINRKSYSGTGTSWKDLSGEANITLDTSLVTYGVNKFTATALNQYIWFGGTNPVLKNLTDDGNSHTFECWFYPLGNVPGANNGYMFGRRGAHTGFQQQGKSIINPVIWYSSGSPQYQYVGNPSGNNPITIASNLNNWAHLVLTVDETNNIARAFYNGLQYGVDTSLTNTLRSYGTADYFILGASGTDYTCNGSVAIARLYNRSLSASEVLTNYNATKSRFGL